jgi:pheromone shutdown protein TraB
MGEPCPAAVYSSTIESPVLLVGTAHVVDVAGPLRSLLTGRPLDGIAVELDSERAQVLLTEAAEERRATRGGPILFRLWALLQRRLGERLGQGVGAEMRSAAELAKEWKLPLFLIDDPVRETLARLLRSMTPRERIRLLAGSLLGLFLPSRMVERHIGSYTEAPEDYLAEIRTAFPGVARVLLDERNEHMATRLAELRGRGFGRLAAVVGDAHLAGLSEALRRRGIATEPVRLGALLAPTRPSVGSSSPAPST